MDKDQVKGAVNDAAGRAKRQVGEWTGDTNAQVEGAAQQIKGKAQKVVGNVKDAARDACNSQSSTARTSRRREESRSVSVSTRTTADLLASIDASAVKSLAGDPMHFDSRTKPRGQATEGSAKHCFFRFPAPRRLLQSFRSHSSSQLDHATSIASREPTPLSGSFCCCAILFASGCIGSALPRSEVRLLKRHRHPHDRRSTGADNALACSGSRAPKSNR